MLCWLYLMIVFSRLGNRLLVVKVTISTKKIISQTIERDLGEKAKLLLPLIVSKDFVIGNMKAQL